MLTIDVLNKGRHQPCSMLRPANWVGPIRCFNVTSANAIRFLPNFVRVIIYYASIWKNSREFGNDTIYIYDFIKHDTSWSSDFTCISVTDYFTQNNSIVNKVYCP